MSTNNKYPYFGVWVNKGKRVIVMFISEYRGYCILDEFECYYSTSREGHMRGGWDEGGFIKLLEHQNYERITN